MLVTEQLRDHHVSKCISPNDLLLHILSLTINSMPSVEMRQEGELGNRFSDKQTESFVLKRMLFTELRRT